MDEKIKTDFYCFYRFWTFTGYAYENGESIAFDTALTHALFGTTEQC